MAQPSRRARDGATTTLGRGGSDLSATLIAAALSADDALRCVILRGAGEKAFSAGNDLKYTAQHGTKGITLGSGGFGGITVATELKQRLGDQHDGQQRRAGDDCPQARR